MYCSNLPRGNILESGDSRPLSQRFPLFVEASIGGIVNRTAWTTVSHE